MFMHDFVKLATEFTGVVRQQPAVTPAPVIGGIVAGEVCLIFKDENVHGWISPLKLAITQHGGRSNSVTERLPFALGNQRDILRYAAWNGHSNTAINPPATVA